MRVATLASGSSGNCALVSDGGAHILIDAGISARRIVTALLSLGLSISDISGILITHEHSDHISGLNTLTKRYGIPLFAPETVGNRVKRGVTGADERLAVIAPGEAFSLCGLEISAFRTPHDTPESVGYVVRGSEIVSLCTDLGHVTEEIYYAMEGSSVVVLEANHDPDMLINGDYPYFLKKRILSESGHLSNTDSAELAAALASSGTKAIVLAHLSRENNTPELARKTIANALVRNGIEPGVHIRLGTAPAEVPLIVDTREDAVCLA